MRIRMSILRNIVFASAHFGTDPNLFWKKMGIPKEQYEQSDLMLDWKPGAEVWDVAREMTGQPLIGLLCGEQTSEMALGLVGHLMQSSPTLSVAFENVARFNLAFSEMFYYHAHPGEHEFEMEFAPTEPYLMQYPDSARHSVEASMSGMLNIGHMLSGKKIKALRVHFAYPPPVADLGHYLRILGNDLRFNHTKSSLVLRSSDAKLPVVGFNADLLRMFEQLAREYIERHQGTSNTAAIVKKVVMDHYHQQIPTLSEVADLLNMAERSLQRKLKTEGVTFQQIMEDMRSEMAIGLIKRKQFTANEIAYMLGYADPGAFRRAFKRWTGLNPGEMAKNRSAEAL